MALAEGRLDMYSGEDGLIVPLMSIGAKGVISVYLMLLLSRHMISALHLQLEMLLRLHSYSLRH